MNSQWLMLCVAVMLVGGQARAADTWYVSEGGDDGNTGVDWGTAWATISNAVVQASSNDTILVSNGTYFVTTEILVDKAVTISGYPPNTNTIVTKTTNEAHRIFRITHDSAIVEYLAITNGNNATPDPAGWQTGCGGAVNMTGGTLQNCLLEKNTYGNWGVGGALQMSGNSTASNCVFRYNAFPAGSYGAAIGIYNNGANCKILDCTIIENSGYPAIYLAAGTIERCTFLSNARGGLNLTGGTVRDSIFDGNTAGSTQGGGLAISGGVLTNCIIRNNKARSGSGVHMSGGLITGCSITNNTPPAWACYEGAGVWMNNGTIQNTLITDNRLADYGTWGAGVHMEGGRLLSCTIANNDCGGPHQSNGDGLGMVGGGIHYEGGSISNCIIYGNTTDRAGDDDNLNGVGVIDACWYSCSTGLVNTAQSNITANPLFVGNGDYHLQSEDGHWTATGWMNDGAQSPCIDAGPPDWPFDNEIDDEMGSVNMGAYGNTAQASRSPQPPAGTVITIL